MSICVQHIRRIFSFAQSPPKAGLRERLGVMRKCSQLTKGHSVITANAEGDKLMSEIAISEKMYARVAEFKQVVEAVIEEKINFDDCVELILGQGIDSMLADLLGSVDQTTLLTSFQQLGSEYPGQVYQYVAETLRRGAAVQERESMRRQLGFPLPTREDSEAQ